MTAQIPDEFRYEGETYDLVGLDGSGLYTPNDFGLETYSSCTACWRGYIMHYDCVDDMLILDSMDANVKELHEVNGVMPGKGKNFMKYTYNDLRLKTKFTGTMLLARNFIQEMYVHMGYQRPMAYRTVYELTVVNGDITKVEDLSERMERMRKEDPGRDAQPRDPSEVREWIERTFSLDYEPTDDS
ncbi:MAG: hypothetical protein ACFFED_03360 [Candidatus Thorarchaeota archaeon]